MLTAQNLLTCDHDGCTKQIAVDASQMHQGSTGEWGQEVRGSAETIGWARSDDGERDFCPEHATDAT